MNVSKKSLRSIGNTHRVDSKNVVFELLREIKSRNRLKPEGVSLLNHRIRSLDEAEWVLEQLNTPGRDYDAVNAIQSRHQVWQRFEFIRSNLSKGYLFYFVCNGCERRTKYLHKVTSYDNYECSTCHGLVYLRSS